VDAGQGKLEKDTIAVVDNLLLGPYPTPWVVKLTMW